MENPDFICFSDESHLGSRFRTIAACSCAYSTYKKVHRDLTKTIESVDAKEFKWKKLTSRNHLALANALRDKAFQIMDHGDLHVDVITWDTQDSRHAVRLRDDRANFERMLFHLLSYTLNQRGRGSVWRVYPDKKSDVDWETVDECLGNRGSRRRDLPNSLFADLAREPAFRIQHLQPTDSVDAPLVQVADLFSGVASFAAENYERFCEWQRDKSPTESLFAYDWDKPSRSQEPKCEFLDGLYEECKRRQYGVSLRTEQMLRTYRQRTPLNFWPYTPQRTDDRAPTKGG